MLKKTSPASAVLSEPLGQTGGKRSVGGQTGGREDEEQGWSRGPPRVLKTRVVQITEQCGGKIPNRIGNTIEISKQEG